jgi:hypothetical protein
MIIHPSHLYLMFLVHCEPHEQEEAENLVTKLEKKLLAINSFGINKKFSLQELRDYLQ